MDERGISTEISALDKRVAIADANITHHQVEANTRYNHIESEIKELRVDIKSLESDVSTLKSFQAKMVGVCLVLPLIGSYLIDKLKI
jgi:peptidoglycan hydrolase CwlO-like protein